MGVVPERTDQDPVLWVEDSSKTNGTWNRYRHALYQIIKRNIIDGRKKSSLFFNSVKKFIASCRGGRKQRNNLAG